MPPPLLVTSGLPYSNGSIHIGHLVEYIQTDIWCRHQRLQGRDCVYVCGDDTHGTPIMIRARRDGVTPEELVTRARAEHIEDFAAFGVEFDEYHHTHSPQNRALSEEIYRALARRGDIESREVEQFYCPKDQVFLPDRLIRGTCPNPACGATDQYGDVCEACGRTHESTELIDPRCAECGTPPVRRKATHLFFLLSRHAAWLAEWTRAHLQPDVANYVAEWIQGGLKDWDISRDAPYFGFEIPDQAGKFFYVWFDAPIGYIASTKAFCERTGRDFDAYWRRRDAAEVRHFIGKDILYFHTLFWPSVLDGAGLNLPSRVHVHGFLTVNGQRMSKSRGTFINARTYRRYLEPEVLRYYYASKLGPTTQDIDLDLDDFVNRVNADLVGKLANLASRFAPIVHRFGGRLTRTADDARPLLADARARVEEARAHYEALETGKAVRVALEIAATANRYIEERAPWDDQKKGDRDRALETSTAAANFLRIVAGLLRPAIPRFASRVDRFLGIEKPEGYAALAEDRLIEDRPIRPYERLAERIDRATVDRVIAASREEQAARVAPPPLPPSPSGRGVGGEGGPPEAAAEPAKPAPAKPVPAAAGAREPVQPTITIDEFQRIDIRVARVLTAEIVPEASKLLRLKVDLGEGDVRQILAGIRAAYDPATLPGRLVLVCANLAPRTMKFGVSEGMVLAAGSGGPSIFVTTVDAGARPGDRIH